MHDCTPATPAATMHALRHTARQQIPWWDSIGSTSIGTPRHQCKRAGVPCCTLSLANSLCFDCGSCAQQPFTLPLGQNAALLPYPCIHSASCAQYYCTLLCPLAKMWLCCGTPVLTVRTLAQHHCSLLCLSAAVGLRCNTRVSTGGATCFVAQVRLCWIPKS